MDYLSFLWIFYTWFLFPPLPPIHLKSIVLYSKNANLQYCKNIASSIIYHITVRLRVDQFQFVICRVNVIIAYFPLVANCLRKKYLERGNNLFKHKVYEYNFWLIFNFSIDSCYMIEHETFKRIFIGRKK